MSVASFLGLVYLTGVRFGEGVLPSQKFFEFFLSKNGIFYLYRMLEDLAYY